MSLTSFASKLFNRLDNGLTYDTTEIYEIITKETTFNPYTFSIDGDTLYFTSLGGKDIYSLNLKSGIMSSEAVKTTNVNITKFQIVGNNILYYATDGKTYKTSIDNSTETEISSILNIRGKNSDNYIMYEYGSPIKIGYITDINTLTKMETDISRAGIMNFNNKYMICSPGGSKTVYINGLFSDTNKTSFEFSNNILYCFCNDEIFCVVELSTRDIYMLSVEDFEKGATVEDWQKVKTIVKIQNPLLSNNYFVYSIEETSNQNVYYTNSGYLLNESGTYNKHYTQTELLYTIDKKLDILQQLLGQFIPPSD